MIICVLSLLPAGCADQSPTETQLESQPVYAYPGDVRLSVARINETKRALDDYPNADRAKAIIADGTITVDEMNEFDRTMAACLSKLGYDGQYDANGTFSMKRLNESDGTTDSTQALDECQTVTGYDVIRTLYSNAVRNPDDVDLGPYVVQCMIDIGAAPQGYTLDEYVKDSRNRTGPYATLDALQDTDPTNSQAQQIRECGYDPLHKADGIIGTPKQ